MSSTEKRETTSGDSIFYKLWRNVRYEARHLTKSPGFTLTAILSLALGIGANTAIFSLVNAILLRELPIVQPEELVDVYISRPDFQHNVFSYPDYEDFRDGTEQVFSDVSASRIALTQIDRNGNVEMQPGEVVTGNYFRLLGIEAAVGRTLLPEDDVRPGAHPVVVLGHAYWQSAYGGDPAAVGQEVRLGGRPYSIVGVAPADYPGNLRGLVPVVFVPMMMVDEIQPSDSSELENRGNHSLFVKARRRSGVSMVQAQAAADGVSGRLSELAPRSWDTRAEFLLIPTESVILYPPFDRFVCASAWLLTTVVSLVLFMACINLASFLLARGLDRRKEIALRLALGARRRHLVAQLLTETALLGLLGGLAGIALAVGLLRVLVAADLPLPLPVTLDLSLDATVLGFSLAISILAGLFLGLAPALQTTNPAVATTLKDETTGHERGKKLFLRNALVVLQVAVSVVLLVCAGLFVRSFDRIQSVDPGFGREPSALLSFMMPTTRYSEEEGHLFVRGMLDRFRELPGVEAVGLTGNLHLNTLSTQTMAVNVDGVEPPPDREAHSADLATVDAGFFEAAGIGILEGRNFEDYDRPDGQPVAIINRAMAEKFWPGRDAVGRMIRRPNAEDLLVVGIAATAKIRSIGEDPRAFVYRPYSQNYTTFLTVVARTTADPERTALDLMAVSRELDPEIWIWEAKSMARHLGIVLLPARLSALLLSVFGGLALALASIGLYGIVSYTVSRRTREVGIRMSLGANTGSVVGLLMGSGLKLVAAGGAVGIVLAVAASRLLSGLLFRVSAFDPFTFIAAPVVLALAAIVAAFLPARRASRVDPVAALRTE